jgi:hypothetical protein
LTLPLPAITGADGRLDPAAVQFAIDVMARQFLDSGGRSLKIRTGTTTISWPGGSVTSDTETVTHGLGSTPAVVLVSVASSGGVSGITLIPTVQAFTYTSTQFSVTAYTVDAQTPLNTATTPISWLAIG